MARTKLLSIENVEVKVKKCMCMLFRMNIWPIYQVQFLEYDVYGGREDTFGAYFMLVYVLNVDSTEVKK